MDQISDPATETKTLTPRQVAEAAKERAVKAVGGAAELARGLDVTRSAVQQWSRVPAERVIDVERLSGVPRHELRPDIYPAPVPSEAASDQLPRE